jgi:transcription antitermination factor NusG
VTHVEQLGVEGSVSRQWYAVAVRSRCEKKVSRGLELRGVERYLPLIEEVHVWSDRKKQVQVPLFPGYLFVRIEIVDRLDVLRVDGVVKFVGGAQRPSPVPEEQIRWVRTLEGHPETLERETLLPVGQAVRVIAGPFQGLRGTIKRMKGMTRVVITLETIGQALSVEVSPEYLEQVEKDAHHG